MVYTNFCLRTPLSGLDCRKLSTTLCIPIDIPLSLSLIIFFVSESSRNAHDWLFLLSRKALIFCTHIKISEQMR